jgi:hypothetical protein
MSEREWRVQIEFTDEERKTRADALLDVGGTHHHGWGQARRNPGDADVPVIGEEVAAARALIRLAHSLLGAAESEIEDIEHHPVRIHT